jgi:CBS domain-containing protein
MKSSDAFVESNIHLGEPIKSLLVQKGCIIFSISSEASVYEAIGLMSEEHIGALVVLSAGRLVGIITERDYARKVILKGRHRKSPATLGNPLSETR